MKLQTLAETVKVEFVRTGFNPQTEQTSFVCIINHETFDFHCGLFACIPKAVTVKGCAGTVTVDPLAKLQRYYKMSMHWHNEDTIFARIRAGQVKAIKNLDNAHVMAVFNAISNLCKPTAYDLLYCLQLDCQAVNTSFENWCAEFGYDNDSIKALNTYNACCENAKKLQRALGRETYAQLMTADSE